MARGVDQVLSLYFDTSQTTTPPRPARDAPRPPAEDAVAIESGDGVEIALPWTPRGVVEPFLVWNLRLALSGHGVALRPSSGSRRGAVALVLQHASARGTREAARRVAALPAHHDAAIVVYGEEADALRPSWLRRLADRSGPRRTSLVHCGGIATGVALARAVLRRDAVVDDPAPDSLGGQLRVAAEALARHAAFRRPVEPPAPT